MPLSTPSILLQRHAPRVSVRVLRGHVRAHLTSVYAHRKCIRTRTALLVLGRGRRGATDPRRFTAPERQRRSCAQIFCLRPSALIAYWAVEPPSMTSSLPVTYEDSSEARYS